MGPSEFNIHLVTSKDDAVIDCLADFLPRTQIKNSGGYVAVTTKLLELLNITSRLVFEGK